MAGNLNETDGMLHPFSLDDLDDQSRVVKSAQASTSRLVPKVVPTESSGAQWFEKLVWKRKRNAILMYTAISALLYLFTIACLQLSLFHPIHSILSFFVILVSPWSHLMLLPYTLLDAGLMLTIGVFLLKFDVERRLSLRSHISWLFFFAFISVDLFKKVIILLAGVGVESGFNDRICLFILGVASATICFWNTFCFSYQLVFPAVELTPSCHVQVAFHTERDKVIKMMIPVFKWTFVISLLFGLPIFGWSFFGGLLNIRFYSTWFLLTFLQLFSHYLGVSVLKGYVLQRYLFSLPPPYFVAWQSQLNVPTLISGLESSSTTLKSFALWDLRDLAIKSKDRRAAIFSLSQPGGHPRNWSAVKDVCKRILTILKDQVEQETCQLQKKTYESLQVDAEDKVKGSGKSGPTILLSNQLYKDKSLHRRVLNSGLSDTAAENSHPADSWVGMFGRWSRSAPSSRITFSSYEGNLAVLCIESLGMLIWYSYDEDSYGVVQKDLQSILSLLLQLMVALDRYIRNNKQVKTDAVLHNLAVVNSLDSAIGSTINRIASKFGSALSGIGLTPLEMDVLETVTGSSKSSGFRDSFS